MVIVRLRANRRIGGIGRVVKLPVYVHETAGKRDKPPFLQS